MKEEPTGFTSRVVFHGSKQIEVPAKLPAGILMIALSEPPDDRPPVGIIVFSDADVENVRHLRHVIAQCLFMLPDGLAHTFGDEAVADAALLLPGITDTDDDDPTQIAFGLSPN